MARDGELGVHDQSMIRGVLDGGLTCSVPVTGPLHRLRAAVKFWGQWRQELGVFKISLGPHLVLPVLVVRAEIIS